ncbi:hypothetical protein SOHN41_01214 [Shewanella sp. HN-41]|nr:hypothetical protein SOHN41_01214 [Shewanella sp. HN-41]
MLLWLILSNFQPWFDCCKYKGLSVSFSSKQTFDGFVADI